MFDVKNILQKFLVDKNILIKTIWADTDVRLPSNNSETQFSLCTLKQLNFPPCFNRLANMFDLTQSPIRPLWSRNIQTNLKSCHLVQGGERFSGKNSWAHARTSWMGSQKKGPVECFLVRVTSLSTCHHLCHHPCRHVIILVILCGSRGETFSGKTFWLRPGHSRKAQLLPLLLTATS